MKTLTLLFLSFFAVSGFAQEPQDPKPSAFNETISRLRAESQQAQPACTEFQNAVKVKPESALAKAELLKKWPGFPNAQLQAIQIILRSKNPPVDLNTKQFLDDYAKLGHCDFPKTVELALDLQTQLKQNVVTTADRKAVVDALNQYLETLANKPGSLLKVAVGLSLAEFLAQGEYVSKLARKDRMIRRLKDQSAQKTTSIQQALLAFADVPTSVTNVWSELHDAERLRMELARLVFFP